MNKKLPQLFAIIFSILSGITAVSAFNIGNNCRDVDLSGQLGPIRDQEEDGICHVAATGYLVTQLLNSEGIKKDFVPSWTDLMACGDKKHPHRFQLPNPGGIPRWSMKCARGKGVCGEELAPYDKRIYLKCNSQNKHRCASDEFRRQCEEFARDRKRKTCNSQGQDPFDLSFLENLSKDSKDIGNESACMEGDEYMDGKMACLKRKLITNECKENRVRIPQKFQPQEFMLAQRPPDEQEKVLCGILNKNKAVALGVCLDNIPLPDLQATLSHFNGTASGGCKAAHAVVVGGSRYNNGKLEYFIRNSWGKDTPFQGWIPAEALHGGMLTATYFSDQVK